MHSVQTARAPRRSRSTDNSRELVDACPAGSARCENRWFRSSWRHRDRPEEDAPVGAGASRHRCLRGSRASQIQNASAGTVRLGEDEMEVVDPAHWDTDGGHGPSLCHAKENYMRAAVLASSPRAAWSEGNVILRTVLVGRIDGLYRTIKCLTIDLAARQHAGCSGGDQRTVKAIVRHRDEPLACGRIRHVITKGTVVWIPRVTADCRWPYRYHDVSSSPGDRPFRDSCRREQGDKVLLGCPGFS